MASEIKIIGFAGSLRAGSYNRKLLEAAAGMLPEGGTLEVYDRLRELPLYDFDVEQAGAPEVVADLKARIRAADAILFATPEYNHSIPGVLKNAIDWGSRPYSDNSWKGRPCAIMGASPGRLGTIRAQLHLRSITQALVMPTVPMPEVLINVSESFDADGNLVFDKAKDLIRRLVAELVELARRYKSGG
jgi:chromate reductase, NAD(P)H dehydrogenase (quinone)